MTPNSRRERSPTIAQAGDPRPAPAKLKIQSGPVQEMIKDLLQRQVPITSTSAVFEAVRPDRPPLETRMLDARSTL